MFSKKKRVNKELFNTIMKEGRMLSTPLFTFKYLSGEPVFAVVAPKSVAKKATLRNALRRRGYAVLRSFSPTANNGLLFYKKQAITASLEDIKQDIGNVLKKSKSL